MAPFPETEIMTIKRLEVALRKMDYKLLKDGAYKLHEKYHSGFKFEYLDLLKDILDQTTSNASIPIEIKDILCPTINDILSGNNAGIVSSNQISNLTQLSYNSSLKEQTAQKEELSEEKREETEVTSSKISAFDVFGADKNSIQEQKPYVSRPITNNYQPEQVKVENVQTSTLQPVHQNINEEIKNEDNPNPNKEETIMQSAKLKTIAIYYGQDNSKDKVKNILNYREMISKYDDEHYSISQILKLISEINVQSDTNVSELKNILDQIKISGSKLNLVTNSSSRELIDLFEKEEYSYALFEEDENKQMTLIPVFGLSNKFLCMNCKEEYLDKNNPIKPLVIECPKCKNPMFPDFYAANKKNNQINMTYYNNALVALANSKVWVLIHPSIEDKLFHSMLINAFKLNREIETVYILEKDINLRESFRSAFASINPNVKIDIQMTALEDFINSLR